MKNWALLLLIYSFCCFSRQSDTLKRARDYYGNQQYQESLKEYHQITKNAAIWYNMGNCAYYMNQYEDALLYWMRAARATTSQTLHAKIRKNLSILETYYEPARLHLQEAGMCRGVWSIITSASSFCLQLLFLVLCLLFIVVVWLSRRNIRSIVMRKFLNGIFFISIISAGSIIYVHYRNNQHRYALTRQQTILYAGPDQNYHTCGNIMLGNLVQIIETQCNWVKIKDQNHIGWASESSLILI